LALAISAVAAQPTVSVTNPWIRTIIPSRPAAGYFVLANDDTRPLILVGASSPACGSMMLHRSTSENGVDGMKAVDSITVPPHGSIALAPGGYHLMCASPGSTLRADTSVPVALSFADGDTLTVMFPVRGANGN
jgi:hypothetical protein